MGKVKRGEKRPKKGKKEIGEKREKSGKGGEKGLRERGV